MKTILNKPTKLLWVVVSIVVFQACYPGDSIPISDLDTVTTVYNSDDFANGAPTSAGIIWQVAQDTSRTDNNLDYNGEVDDEILNTTLEELIKIYGVDSVYIIWGDPDNNPDPMPGNPNVKILVDGDPVPYIGALYTASVILNEKTVGIVYPGYPWYGGGWWGGWYPGYPCYYCYYPPTVGYQKYEVGTIVLDMYDLAKILGQNPVPDNPDPSWVGAMRGLLSSNPESNAARTVSGIQQAFAQSPYLKN